VDPTEPMRRPTADGLDRLAGAMWWDAHGDWDRAPQLAQSVDTADGAWVHAYLHRKEGDLPNADDWYRRAGRRRPSGPLEAEWAAIVSALCPPPRARADRSRSRGPGALEASSAPKA
jgi:hypothetical protein